MDPSAGGRLLTLLHADFHRGWGGQIDVVLTACRGLRARGHRVILAVPGGGRPAATARGEGLEVFGEVAFRSSGHPVSLLRDAFRLRRLLRRERPDVLHSNGSQDTWALILANRVLPGAPQLVHLRTRHNTKRVPYNAANRYMLRRGLSGMIVVAREVLERYRPFIEHGDLDPELVPEIPAPLRPDLLAGAPPDRAKVRGELAAGDDALLVGTAARLVPDKGQEYLIEAAAQLGAKRPGLRVVLAGDGDATEALRARAEALGIADRVHFLGFRRDVADILSALDIAVLPSVDCDASSGMVKESLAVGTPVVATEIGGARGIMGGGRFGLLVPPRDAAALAGAIDAMAADLPHWRALAVEGGAWVRGRYTAERLIDDLELAYRTALARSAAAAGR